MKRVFRALAVLAAVFCVLSAASAEHPGAAGWDTKQKDHPGKKAMFASGDVINGINDYIQSVSEENNGYFPLYDSEEGKSLRLTLVKVHEDKVSYLKKEDAYFACTDFLAEDGKTTYDVDFWMKKSPEGRLEIYKTKIHKKDGKPRFIYKDDEINYIK